MPRYNEFRRLFHLKPFDTFEEMADTPEHAESCAASTATSNGSTR